MLSNDKLACKVTAIHFRPLPAEILGIIEKVFLNHKFLDPSMKFGNITGINFLAHREHRYTLSLYP
jgi:hypothetical protein